ncbi:N-acetyltransferase [Bifidobacterium xylocopae]|uniref:N-acetyltransferase n=1 Tax=Bifidobacterium xylocopae TaxID=2493119 RepID=A0A366KEK4_9BIFI|nr:N-acetyltransferase [Bifidobacterium xylocopae]RBQ00131.1 N-acetyltransferase [Bifidobacterium xylocopae]
MDDVAAVTSVLDRARQAMVEAGNPNQWGSKYPDSETITGDIQGGHAILLVDDAAADPSATEGASYRRPEMDERRGEHERVIGVFALFDEPDPFYSRIDGAWLDDDPYMTIHRMASSGLAKGVAGDMLDWCMRHYSNVRVDTGYKNHAMQHILEAHGFTRCGEIAMPGADDPNMELERVAYQRHDR